MHIPRTGTTSIVQNTFRTSHTLGLNKLYIPHTGTTSTVHPIKLGLHKLHIQHTGTASTAHTGTTSIVHPTYWDYIKCTSHILELYQMYILDTDSTSSMFIHDTSPGLSTGSTLKFP